MASIEARGGSYRIKVLMYRDENGKRHYETTTYTPKATTPAAIKKEVQKFADEFEERAKNGNVLPGEKLKFSDVVEIWKSSMKFQRLTESTQMGYVSTLEKWVFPYLGNMIITKIKPLNIQKIYDDMQANGRAAKTIKRANTALNSVLDYAYRKEIINDNPCLRVELPRTEKRLEIHRYTDDQINRFLSSMLTPYTINHPEIIRKNGRKIPAYTETVTVQYQFYVYFNMAFFCGCRRGEMIALTWQDIDFDGQLIFIEKAVARAKNGTVEKDTKSKAGERVLPMTGELAAILKQWKKEQMQQALSAGDAWKGFKGKDFDRNSIFIQKDGQRMDLSTPTHKFKEIVALYNSNIDDPEKQLPMIHLHDARHTFGSALFDADVPTSEIAYLMGHASISTTLDNYVHPKKADPHEIRKRLSAIHQAKAN